MYLYLIMCLICLFIVATKSSNQYISKIGQKTGTSNMLTKVMKNATMKDLVKAYLYPDTCNYVSQSLEGSKPHRFGHIENGTVASRFPPSCHATRVFESLAFPTTI
mmetsp:Transcript_1177/g.7640  ORF Transcript_1177/g.7640 Transcript_1177/m.7640 type:complete len:106 (-) Transcript_1177:2634-2951(-)